MTKQLKVLSLFSGGGLGDYGLELTGMEIIGQVEIDDYCQKILSLRWPTVPKWRDICEVKSEVVRGTIGTPDIISGGFPCQDISIAGNGEGIYGKRSGLWKEMFRLVCDLRPKYVLVENVAALLHRGLGVVLSDLSSIGYDAEWQVISACQFGAAHSRERVFILAYPHSASREIPPILSWDGSTSTFFDKHKTEWCKNWFGLSMGRKAVARLENEWEEGCPKPEFLRVVDGTPEYLDRLKLLGNGQVVQVVQYIGERIIEFELAGLMIPAENNGG